MYRGSCHRWAAAGRNGPRKGTSSGWPLGGEGDTLRQSQEWVPRVVSAPGGSGLANSPTPGSLQVTGEPSESISSCLQLQGKPVLAQSLWGLPEPQATLPRPSQHSPAFAAALSAAAEAAPGNTPPGKAAPGNRPPAPVGRTTSISIPKKQLPRGGPALVVGTGVGELWGVRGSARAGVRLGEAALAGTALSCIPQICAPIHIPPGTHNTCSGC